jgi:hypothetical protein
MLPSSGAQQFSRQRAEQAGARGLHDRRQAPGVQAEAAVLGRRQRGEHPGLPGGLLQFQPQRVVHRAAVHHDLPLDGQHGVADEGAGALGEFLRVGHVPTPALSAVLGLIAPEPETRTCTP